jgi:hydroxypyruvate isomerase
MPFDKALEQIAAMGFPAFERLGWEGLDLEAVRKKADELGLEYSCIVGAGRIAPGGLVNPEDHDKVIEQFKKAVEAAHKLNVKRLVALSGNERNDVSRDQQKQYIIEGLKKLAPIAEAEKVTLVLEPLNVLVDHRGYFLSRSDEAAEILKAVNSPNVKMLFDIYHQQITEGNLIRNIKRNIDLIGHFHVADNPGRHEPGTGEINYRNVFKAIYETGYRELVALEFSPSRGATAEQVLQAVIDADQW